MANPDPDTRGLKPAQKGEPSRNPSGVSREKVKLRQAFEEFVIQEGRFDEYLKRLHTIATKGADKVAVSAIREFLDKALGKDFHLDLDKPDIEGMRILFVHTIKNPDGTEINVTEDELKRIIDAEEAGKFK